MTIQPFYEKLLNLIFTIDWHISITTFATVTLAILTYAYVRLTQRILQAQTDPCVIVSVTHDEKRPTILQLVMRNIGAGLAYDIRFELSKPIPSRAWGLSVDKAKPSEQMSTGPLIEGIPALGPGEERKID